MKRRFLCIYFPNWSVDLIQRNLPIHVAPEGILLIGKINNQATVIRQCSKAKRTGIKVGSALSSSFSTECDCKRFRSSAPDFKALYKLCAWTNKYTPLNGLDIEIIESYKQKLLWKIDSLHYGINLDITGTERLSKGEHVLVKNINEKMIKARFEARIAVASTFGAAWALSRFIPEKLYIAKSSIASELNSLPVESLRLAENATAALKDVGIRNVGTLLTLPRKAIAKRYGSKTLRRLD